MKKYVLMLISFLVAACGSDNTVVKNLRGNDGVAGEAGKDGRDGIDGSNGAAGASGHNALVSILNSAVSCTNGGVTILTGTDANDNGVLDISDTGLSSAEVCNGAEGAQGEQGEPGIPGAPSPFELAEIIDPCGPQGSYDEVLLKLANGMILASFSTNGNANTVRFAIIPNGTYVTTDQTNCVFSVLDGVVSW